MIVASANDQERVQKLRENLDPGETEAIMLAIERRADLLLVDERHARHSRCCGHSGRESPRRRGQSEKGLV